MLNRSYKKKKKRIGRFTLTIKFALMGLSFFNAKCILGLPYLKVNITFEGFLFFIFITIKVINAW